MLARCAQLLQQGRRQVLHATFKIYQHNVCRKCMYANGPIKSYYQLRSQPQQLYRAYVETRQRVSCVRLYSKNENKTIEAAAVVTKIPSNSLKNESKQAEKQPQHLTNLTQTKNFEVKTTKGVLSITTTIEDSKINDIVFEKTKMPTSLEVKNINVTTAPKKITAISKSSAEKLVTIEPKTIIEQKKPTAVETVKKIIKDAMPKTITPQQQQQQKHKQTQLSAALVGAAVFDVKSSEQQSKPKRARFDYNRSSLERNFITPARAMSDFLLKASDLESLPKIKRRSPYEQEPPITVFWRRDVEAKAFEIWGSRENLMKEVLKRDLERKQYQQNIFTVKRRLRDYRREIGARTLSFSDDARGGLQGKSGQVVLTAIAINGTNFLVKFGGWLYSGSHSMFAECVHSLADMINQIILAYGIHKSVQVPDTAHPYGYSNMKYVSALISGVGIFCVGCGVSIYHGITGIIHPAPLEDLFWAYFILGGTLCSEGATLVVAINKLVRSAKKQNMTFKDYVVSGTDPCVNVVLMEDAAAVAGVLVASACMGLSSWTSSSVYDAVGSLLIGGILGGVASFIIYTNVQALVGKTIVHERLEKINNVLESDVMIRAIHDVKGIDIGNSMVRYKAELDFDGRELTRSYLDKQDLNELLETVKSFRTVDQLEQFLLDHGENIVDLMGGEIDRIEMNLRSQFPEIRHCDLEVL